MCFNLNILNICLSKTTNKQSRKVSSDSISSSTKPTIVAENKSKIPVNQPIEAGVHHNPPFPSTTPLIQPPRTLALKTSNNLNLAVSELECDNEETLNSLYLANNISYLVDRDLIIDTPGNQAAIIDDSVDLDDCSYDSDFDTHNQTYKSSQPLLKFLTKSTRVETTYKSISTNEAQSLNNCFVHPPPRPSQDLFKPKTLANKNRNSSPSSSSSKSSSFSSLVNTSSNQSPYSSVSTLIQQQLKLKPVKMFQGGDEQSNISAPNRPSLSAGMTRPGLVANSSPQVSSPKLKMENLRPKKQAYYFNADNQHLISRPNELMSQDDHELSSMLDEELNNSKTDESNLIAASRGDNHHHQQRNTHHGHHRHHHNDRYSFHNIKSRGGKITISPNQVYEFKESDFEDLGQIGNGEFGSVHMVRHKPSETMMAMKRVGPTVGNQGERKKVLKELDFVLECNDHDYVVKFYGVKFNNEPADCLICMELMDTSLEKFYKFVYDVKHEEIPEDILGKVVVAAVNALNYLKEEYQIIHRDVKPSNMLINRRGEIKMCDFGISGKLVDSIAASRDAGCQLYMAPERIDPTKACANGYDVRSDVWSLGITLYELATGKFPYPQWKTIFHQLNLVVDSEAPRLESERLSLEFKDFVNTCLTKDEKKRPKYKVLLQHPLIKHHSASMVDVAAYVEPYINEMKASSSFK